MKIVQITALVNKTVTWHTWQSFLADVLHHLAGSNVHDRCEYGELRLGRLNLICRLKWHELTYFNVHRDYSSYFGQNYTTLVALFALVSVALSAMQVMTNVNVVPAGATITSYQFAIATLIALAGSCAVLFASYI